MNKKTTTKINRKRLKRLVEKELRTHHKKNSALLQRQLNEVTAAKNKLAEENEYLLNENDIFIPVLDEATGEKTYATKDFNEFLLEIDNDKTKNPYSRYDGVYDVLNESVAHEATLYFNESLEPIDEAIGDIIQKGKDVVAKGVEKAKEVYKKGKLFFFLKIVEQGLKLAVKVSRGIQPLINKLMMKMIMSLMKKWAAGKAKVGEAFEQLKNWGKTKLIAIMKKVIKPFGWITQKLGNQAGKASELVPVLLSIAGLCLILAIMYASTCLVSYEGGAATFQSAMNDTMEKLESVPGGEELIGGMCIAENIRRKGNNRNPKLLKEAVCELIDAQGAEMSNEVKAAFMKNLTADINKYAESAEGLSMSQWETVADGQVVSAGQSIVQGRGVTDMAGATLDKMRAAMTIAGNPESAVVNISKATGAQKRYLMGVLKRSAADAAKMTAAGVEISDAALDKLGDSVTMTHEVQSEFMDKAVQTTKQGVSVVAQKLADASVVTVKAAKMGKVPGLDEAKNTFASDTQMKQLFENWRAHENS